MWGQINPAIGNAVERIWLRPEAFSYMDNSYPREVFTLWTDQERADINIYPAEYMNEAPNPYYDLTGDDGGIYNSTSQVVEITRTYQAKGLAETQISLRNQTDDDAEGQRLRHITGGSGQSMTYMEKAREAEKFIALPQAERDTATGTDFPLLNASVQAGEAADLSSAANLIDANYTAWIGQSADIDEIRLAGKRSIAAATTVDDAWAAYKAIQWPIMLGTRRL